MVPVKVVIVEDDENIVRPQILEQLERTHETTSISIEHECFLTLEDFDDSMGRGKTKPDIIILDLKFDDNPWEEGLNTLDQSLGKPAVPVIVYSAYADQIPKNVKYANILIGTIKKGSEKAGNKLQDYLNSFVRMKARLNEFHSELSNQFEALTLEAVGEIMDNCDSELPDENIIASLVSARLITYLMNSPPAG